MGTTHVDLGPLPGSQPKKYCGSGVPTGFASLPQEEVRHPCSWASCGVAANILTRLSGIINKQTPDAMDQ